MAPQKGGIYYTLATTYHYPYKVKRKNIWVPFLACIILPYWPLVLAFIFFHIIFCFLALEQNHKQSSFESFMMSHTLERVEGFNPRIVVRKGYNNLKL